MIACKEYAAPNYLLNTGYKFLVQRPQDPDEAGITLQSDVRIYCAADWKHFQELIQRGSNLWPDAPPEIKEFADLVTNGKVMQDYYRQAGVAAESKPVAETGWPYNDKIQCAKRIMEAVETYHERPDAVNRSALRSVILTELDE